MELGGEEEGLRLDDAGCDGDDAGHGLQREVTLRGVTVSERIDLVEGR